eukprot:6182278-Pleurochrysis_carterae.AAC.3
MTGRTEGGLTPRAGAEAVPPLATAQSDRAFRATRSRPRTPSFGVYLPCYISRRYRHWLPRSPIGLSRPHGLDHARLHLACTLPSYILRDPPGATIQEHGGELNISLNTNNQRSGSERGRGGWARSGSGSGALR